MTRRWLATLLLLAPLAAGAVDFCSESPLAVPPRSVGSPSKGSVEGAVALRDGQAARVLPKRHKARCLAWGTPRLVEALERAGKAVQARYPDSPPLGVGDLGRATGGSIRPLSHSHQAGRDVDLAFYVLDSDGRPVPAEDLTHFGDSLKSHGLRLDVPRTWALVESLVSDGSIDVRWLFVSTPIAAALLDEASRVKARPELVERARALLHQPSDAPPHDDHLHLRIRCTKAEREQGCRDG